MKARYVGTLAVIKGISLFHYVALILFGISSGVIIWNYWLQVGGSPLLLVAEYAVIYCILLYQYCSSQIGTIRDCILSPDEARRLVRLQRYVATLARKYSIQTPIVRVTDDPRVQSMGISTEAFRRKNVLITGQLFRELSESTLKLFIAHEIGHGHSWQIRIIDTLKVLIAPFVRLPYLLLVPAIWSMITFSGMPWAVLRLFAMVFVVNFCLRLLFDQQKRMGEYAADMYMLEESGSVVEVTHAFREMESQFVSHGLRVYNSIFGYGQNAVEKAFRCHPTNPERLHVLRYLAYRSDNLFS